MIFTFHFGEEQELLNMRIINLLNPQFHWGTQKRLTFSEFDEISPFCESSKG